MYRNLWFIPECLLVIWILYILLQRDSYSAGMGYFLICSLLVFIPKLIFSFVDGLLKTIKYIIRRPIPHVYIALFPAFIIAGCIFYGMGWGKTRFTVHHVDFYSSKLPPSFDGYRIVQLSDIHIGSWGNDTLSLAHAVELCNNENPHLIVFTGDLINNRAEEVLPFIPQLSRLKAKDGVYSILGNHDYGTHWHWKSKQDSLENISRLCTFEAQMGWTMLNNSHTFLRRGQPIQDSIALIGVENIGNPPFPNRGDLKKALNLVNTPFKILLSHDPTHWKKEILPHSDIQLTLSGHTHDMQFSIFGYSPSVWFYPEHRGLYSQGQQSLYVNIGLGYLSLPFRWEAWPEITVITLHKSTR